MKHGKIKQRMFLVAAVLVATAVGLAATMLLNKKQPIKTDTSKKETIRLWYSSPDTSRISTRISVRL